MEVVRKGLSILEILINESKKYCGLSSSRRLQTYASLCTHPPHLMKQKDLEINFIITGLETEANYFVSPCLRILTCVRSCGKGTNGKYLHSFIHSFKTLCTHCEYLLCARKHAGMTVSE